jgi:hypothetical protein
MQRLSEGPPARADDDEQGCRHAVVHGAARDGCKSGIATASSVSRLEDAEEGQ